MSRGPTECGAWWRRAPWLAFVLLWLATGAAAQPYPANGNFAQGGDPPAGWSLDGVVQGRGSIALRPAPGGLAGQMLVLLPNHRNTVPDRPFGIGQLLPADAFRGRDVVVSAVLGASGGARAVVGFAALSRNGGTPVLLRGDGAPTPRQERVRVPDDPALQGIVIFAVAEGTTGEASFATISVRLAEAGNAVPPPGAPPTTAPPAPRSGAIDPFARTPAIAAAVRVDAARMLRPIPRGLFGTNIEVIREANGLWDARAGRLDPQIVALARDLRLGPIRFPGGVWADTYDWRKGVGPVDRRGTSPTHPGASETYRHSFGTDELLSFATAVDAPVLLTVNAASGTPELAADWVRYVNGEGGRSPRGGRVDLWQVGNELYMAGDASGGHLTPQAYADKFLAFATAMRAVDPAIRIGAIGLRNAGRYRLNAHANWNEVVLRRAGPAMDLLTVHNGYAPVVGDDAALSLADVYAAMWAAPVLVARNLAETWDEVTRFAPAHAGRIRLGVTEWGPLFAVSPGSPWLDHVKTLGSAVFVASMLKTFAEQPNLEVANFFKLNEHLFMGWIGRRTAGGPWTPTAPYLAFRMVSRDMQPMLLASQVEVASYAIRAVGFVDRVARVPYLDVLATRSGTGGTVTVLLVNKHLTSPVAARVDLAGMGGGATAIAQTLTGAAVDAHTGTELPRIPGLAWGAPRAAGPSGRITQGGADEVRLESRDVATSGAGATVEVPPHSVVLLRFDGVRP